MKRTSLLILSLFFSCQMFKKKNDDFSILLGLSLFLNQPPTCSPVIEDPLFLNQWHIQNTGQLGGITGEDGKVVGIWQEGNWGYGTKIAIVDDGMDTHHQDLKENVWFPLNYNYVTSTTDLSTHYFYAQHGTSVAGVASGRCNDIGIRGIAPLANLIGYNVLLANSNSLNADAMIRNKND
ncbi:MAG: S8 family serine peptidase, partial [Leptonema sp. (in: bacteria)]